MKKFIGAITLTTLTTVLALGSTSIAKWQGDAKGAFAMYYDDGVESAQTYAIPCLKKYNIPGTFYIPIQWYEHRPDYLKTWFEQVDNKIIFMGNHSYTHNGVKSYENAVEEIGKNDRLIREGVGMDENALISFARPGAVAWEITPEQETEILTNHSEILRPTINKFGIENVGARTHKTAADFIPTLDKIEEHGIFDSVIFHGIGGDWFNFDAAEHEKLCQELVRRKINGTLWTDATINIQKYIAERNGATVKVISEFNENGVAELELTVTTDPKVYDVPLTLVTTIPNGEWKGCKIIQGDTVISVPQFDGVVKYNVAPVSGKITLQLRK